MKTKRMAIIVTAALMSSQVAVAAGSEPIWAGHFEDAYGDTLQQSNGFRSSPGDSNLKNVLVWSGHFQQAYAPSSESVRVASSSSGSKLAERLLWGERFKEVYTPASGDMEAVEAIGEVAMTQK